MGQPVVLKYNNINIKLYTYTVKHNQVYLPYWLLVAAITAIITPIFYKDFKKVGYIL